jgi:magnesium chelatase subunit D
MPATGGIGPAQEAPVDRAHGGPDGPAPAMRDDDPGRARADPSPAEHAAGRWADALRAAALLAVDPWSLGGVTVRAGHGPVRERLLTVMRGLLPEGSPWRRVPIHAGDDRLLGGLDLTATLAAGRPVGQAGLLAEADGGVLLLAMAERVPASTAARLCAALDTGECAVAREGLAAARPARFGVVALDEGTGDDPPPAAALLERLAFRLDLADVPLSIVAAFGGGREAAFAVAGVADPDDGAPDRAAVAAARARLAAVTVDDAVLRALCATAAALGVDSARASLMALRAARAAAALEGRDAVDDDDAALAARLVLAPRATRWPAPADAPPEQAPPPAPEDRAPDEPDASAPDDAPPPREPDAPLDDVVLEAAKAAIPADLLSGLMLAAGLAGAAGSGRAGALRAGRLRGRPAGTRPGLPRDGARLALVDTLRAAAPWQPLRRREAAALAHADRATVGAAPRLSLRASDLRVSRLQERTETTTIFAIDASGSAALHRLAEAKGAVELLLADCYVRRDRVAVVAFRGRGAEVLLPPTRSLVRAKRSLAGLPGGGGTPLASGIDAAATLADAVVRRGGSPIVVLLTDGRANVARDGAGGRARAADEAIDAARRLRAGGHGALLLDTSPQPASAAQALAAAMAAAYVPLPRADADAIARPVRAMAGAARRGPDRGR